MVNNTIISKMIVVDFPGESTFGDEEMGSWKLKGCPRCNGDLSVGKAEDGRYENCLQCGYTHYSENIAKLKIQNPTVFKEPITVEH